MKGNSKGSHKVKDKLCIIRDNGSTKAHLKVGEPTAKANTSTGNSIILS